jgi:protein O-GlcNAc transferase
MRADSGRAFASQFVLSGEWLYKIASPMAQLTIQQAFDLAMQHHRSGGLQQAERLYRQILAQQPKHADAMHYLGIIAHQVGRNDIAVDLIGRAIAVRPNYAEAHCNLGLALSGQGRLDEAIAAYRQAIALKPNDAEAHNNLGAALNGKRRLDEAIAACRQAIALRPKYAEAYSNLGNALVAKGERDEAIAAWRQAIAIRPEYAEAYSNLGNALVSKGEHDEAIAAWRQAVALNPNVPPAHNNLGNALKDQGQIDEAIAAYRQAIALKPNDAEAHSNLLLTLHYHPAYDAQAIAEEHRRWNLQHAQPLKELIQPHTNDHDPDRRLRIGYVSADFGEHPVGRFLLPLLEHHDHQQFEVFCYSNASRIDGITTKLRSCADHWREIPGLSDEQAAGKIRADGIDILIDLSGHTAHNRLLVFARKPAPIQVSYLGYPGPTGLSVIDYRLSDSFADPSDLPDYFHAEALHRLPHTNWCFAVSEESPPVEASPAIRQGHVTFGSFNNFAKVTETMLQVWGRILREVPGSRLLLKAAALAAPSVQQRVRRDFAALGIDAGRLSLRSREPDHATHLALYNQIDIALDTFPYHGTTTTCDALWMGVPVITLAGQTHVSRVGLSLLSNIGLPELIAFTQDQYVQIAVGLAKDQDRMDALRRGMRARMLTSPLMDAPGFARDVEAAYRQMWNIWCKTVPAKS